MEAPGTTTGQLLKLQRTIRLVAMEMAGREAVTATQTWQLGLPQRRQHLQLLANLAAQIGVVDVAFVHLASAAARVATHRAPLCVQPRRNRLLHVCTIVSRLQ